MIYDVIIIGGGVAGLSAMKILQKELRCLLLEASHLLGGRVCSVPLENGQFWDVGARWIHDFEPTHPFFNLCEVCSGADRSEFFYVNANKRMRNIGGEYEAFVNIRSGKTPVPNFLSEVQRFFLQCETGFRDVSLDTFSMFEKTSVHEDRTTIDGYHSLIRNLLIKHLDKASVRCRRQVTNISTGKDFVSIKTTAETYNAKTVLITPSLGVLKENSEAFSINKQKIEALNCLDFGKAERIVFKILEPLEKKMIENEYIVTTSVGIAHVEIIGNGPRYASVFIPCPLKIDRNSCLLVGIEIAEALTLANRLALVHSSNWSLNPLYLGAYASPIKNGRKWRSILSQPDPPYFFAGEATHEEHFGTVHGAYLSGERAAAQVMAAFTMSP